MSGQETEASKDKALRDVLGGYNTMMQAARLLIMHGLMQIAPGLEAAEEQAAMTLRAAIADLDAPQSAVTRIEHDLELAEAEAATWQDRLATGDTAARVQARVQLTAWRDELARLTEQRDVAEADLQPLYATRNKARNELESVQTATRGLAFSIAAPFATAAGQATASYRTWRWPGLVYLLLSGNRDDPEWDAALAMLEALCISSGYRTTGLPSDSEQYRRRVWDSFPDAASEPAVHPSASEIMTQTRADAEHGRIQQHPAVGEPPRPAPGSVGPSQPSTPR